jgi:hypothetical protein
MKKYLLVGVSLIFFSCPVLGKKWCNAEPISPNGDTYIRFDETSEEVACDQALKECEAIYKYCEIIGCGDWVNDQSPFMKICKVSTV